MSSVFPLFDGVGYALHARGLKKGDLSGFIERAVAAAVFDQMVADIYERNRNVDPAILDAEIEEAIRDVRAEKRGLSSHVERRRSEFSA